MDLKKENVQDGQSAFSLLRGWFNAEKEEYDNGFEAEIIEQETFRIVRKAVEELPTQMRNIILYSMKGLKNNEIADKLQISEGTVHKLKKIAYRKLRESLKGINYILCLFLCK